MEFKKFEESYLGSKEDIEAKIRKDTEEQIEAMKKSVANNKQQVSHLTLNFLRKSAIE